MGFIIITKINENRRKPKMEDRKLRLLKKALKLYGVDDEKQIEFIKDLEELENTPDDEVEEVDDEKEVEEEKTEPKIEAEEPIEEKVDEVSEEKGEEEIAEPSVDYEAKFKALDEVNASLNAKIEKLTEMVSALGLPIEKKEDDAFDTPFGNQEVSPIKREDADDDAYLRRRLGGR